MNIPFNRSRTALSVAILALAIVPALLSAEIQKPATQTPAQAIPPEIKAMADQLERSALTGEKVLIDSRIAADWLRQLATFQRAYATTFKAYPDVVKLFEDRAAVYETAALAVELIARKFPESAAPPAP